MMDSLVSRWQTLSTDRRPVILSLLLASLLWMAGLARMWWQPIVADDHLVYASAVTWPNSPMRVNPPLYIYSVRLSFALFGQSVGSARLPGVLSGFITLFLIPPVITLALGTSEQTNWTATLAIWLYATSPQAVQNMMFIDIDTAFLTAALLGLVWLWLKIETGTARQRIILLGLGFALTLWVKLLSPVLAMGSICLFYLIQKQWRRLLEILAASILGWLVFRLTFQFDLTSRYALGYTGGQFTRLNILDPENVRFMATIFPQGAGVMILWLSIPVVILLVMASINSVRRWQQNRANFVDGLLLYGGGCALAYTVVIFPAWGYPRYQSPFNLILILVAAITLAPALSQIPRSGRWIMAIIGITCFVYNTWAVGDPLLRLYLLTFETTTDQVNVRLQQGIADATRMIVPLVIAWVTSFWVAPRLHVRRSTILKAATGIVAFATLISTTLIQVNARYSTRYRYGYGLDDLMQAAKRISDYVGPTGYVAAIDDVLFYTGRDGVGIYGMSTRNLMGETPISLLDLLRQRHIDAMAWTTKDAVRSADLVHAPEMERILTECFSLETFGVFQVYLRKPQVTCP